MSKNKFEKLLSLNVNSKTENKNGLKYLSWTYAWSEFKKVYPDANYEIFKDEVTKLPYVRDLETGYMVYTKVTAGGITHEMWLFVMDGANKAMKSKTYTYKVKDWKASNTQNKTIMMEKEVNAASMFDINKTIMRCLTKNIAMFGLGLYVYSKEDLPEEIIELINDEQIKEIDKLLSETKSDKPKFLEFLKINKLNELFESNFDYVINLLNEKLSKQNDNN